VTLPELGSTLPEIVLRTAIVYFFLVLILRVTGKREVGQMSILELIVILVISDAVQNSDGRREHVPVGRPGRGRDPVRGRQPAQVRDATGRCASRRRWKASPGSSSADGRILTKALDEEGVDVDDVRAAARGAGNRPARRRPARRPRDRRVDQHHRDGRRVPADHRHPSEI
jgi:hypothetical protein